MRMVDRLPLFRETTRAGLEPPLGGGLFAHSRSGAIRLQVFESVIKTFIRDAGINPARIRLFGPGRFGRLGYSNQGVWG